MMKLILTIKDVDPNKVALVTDALNEVLYDLAADNAIDDSDDEGWRYDEVRVLV